MEFNPELNPEFKPTLADEYGLCETLVSFANTEGGLVIVGVNDDGSIRGFVQDERKIERKLWGLVKYRCEPLIDFTTEWIRAHNLPLLLIKVKEGNDKPYNYKDKGIYIREGEHDFRIDRRKLDEIYSKNPQKTRTDDIYEV